MCRRGRPGGSEAFGPDPADLEMDTRARQPHWEKSRAEHSLTRGTPSLPGTRPRAWLVGWRLAKVCGQLAV